MVTKEEEIHEETCKLPQMNTRITFRTTEVILWRDKAPVIIINSELSRHLSKREEGNRRIRVF